MAGESIVMKLQPDGSITGLRVPDSSALTLEISGSDNVRLAVDSDRGILIVEQYIDGIWEPASFATGPESLWIGRAVGIAAGGHHILTEDHTGQYHFHTHSDFDGDLSLSDSKTLYAYYFSEGYIAQDDDSNEWIGTAFNWQSTATIYGLMQKGYWRTGSVAATEPVRIQVWEGTGMGGFLIFDQTYPASTFPANSEVGTHEAGFIELEVGMTYFTQISSTATFSLKTNAAETEPWTAIDLVMVRYDNLLQTTEWEETTYNVGQYFIDSRQIYVCNVTGAQTGTFEDNAAKWDLMGDQYIESLFTETAIPFAGTDGKLTEAPTDLFYDAFGYLHAPGLAIWNDGAILKHKHGLSLTLNQEAEAVFNLIHINSDTKSAYFKYDSVADEFLLSKPLKVDSRLQVDGPLWVNATEIAGADGEVNKAVVEDSDTWDLAYGWGDHSIVGYLTSETDPVFIAWDKSTGIEIIESQITDLDHFTTNDETDPIFIAWDKSTGISITESQVSDLSHFVTGDETDPIFSAWDKSTGISITEAQVSDLSHFVTGDETDPIFSAWDKSTGISITTSQVSDHSYGVADLEDMAQSRIPYGSAFGGLDQSASFTYDGDLSIGDGGIFLDRTGNDSFISFYVDGSPSGQIRADGANISITSDSGAINRLTVNVDTGAAWIQTSLDVPEVSNTLGDLKIQPDVQGDVIMFGDTSVANNEAGKNLYIYRKAPEGNEYIRFFISDTQKGFIHTSCPLTLQAQVDFIINSVTEDIIFKVGDNAGVKKFYFRDSDSVDLFTIDSDAQANLYGNMLVEGVDGYDSAGETATLYLGDVNTYLESTRNVVLDIMGYNGVSVSDYATGVIATFQDGLLGIGKVAELYQLELLSTAPALFLENSRTIMGLGYGVGSILFSAGEGGTHEVVGEIRLSATADWTDTSSPTKMVFYTTPVAAHHAEIAMTLDDEKNLTIEGDLIVGGAYPGAAAKEYASFYLSDTGVSGVGANTVTLVLNQELVNTNGAIFSLTSSEVTVNKTGDFKITADCYFNNSSSTRTEYSFWLEDNGVEVDGTRVGMYCRGYDSGSTGSFSIILPIISGHTFRLRVVRTDGNGTTGYQDNQGTRLTFLEI